MTTYVIDASVAIKWVVTEDATDPAVALVGDNQLAAPDLLVVECANILWKKVRLAEISADASLLAARLLERSEIELVPMRDILARALQLAVEFNHPAYDCAYLALAEMRACPFVTADNKLVHKMRGARAHSLRASVLSLSEAAAA